NALLPEVIHHATVWLRSVAQTRELTSCCDGLETSSVTMRHEALACLVYQTRLADRAIVLPVSLIFVRLLRDRVVLLRAPQVRPGSRTLTKERDEFIVSEQLRVERRSMTLKDRGCHQVPLSRWARRPGSERRRSS